MKEQQQLRQRIREEARKLVEENEPDGEHAKDKLREVNKFSKMLMRLIRDREELPNWVMDKISLAADDMNEIYQYMESERLD